MHFFIKLTKTNSAKEVKKMTLQERNEYLNEQFWFMKERQHLFDLSNLKEGRKYSKYSDILQLVGIDKEGRKSHYAVHKANLSHFVNVKKQKDGQVKVTKARGEYVENPFSWELKSPFMSTGYMLEMMIIYILDNHINDNWSQYDWCNKLGLICGNKKDYDLSDFKYPVEYFHTAYEAIKDCAQGRFRNAIVSLQERGVIKKHVKIICRNHPKAEWRPFTPREEEIYKHCLGVVCHTNADVDIYSTHMYTNVFPKFKHEIKKYPEFQNLYFKFVYDLEYLYPQEHSYLREYEFYMYQKRIQNNLTDKYIKVAQRRKDDLINNYTVKYMNKVRKPLLDGLNMTEEELSDVSTNFIHEYYEKKHVRYKTDVRKVIIFLQKHGKISPLFGRGFRPPVMYQTA